MSNSEKTIKKIKLYETTIKLLKELYVDIVSTETISTKENTAVISTIQLFTNKLKSITDEVQEQK